MKSVIVFDTAIGTSNLGDEIINQCICEEMSFLLDECFVMRWGTHLKNLSKFRYIGGNPKLRFSDEADYKLIMGTNLLSRRIEKTQVQWPISGLDTWLYENSILLGVGTTFSNGPVSRHSRKIYQKILRKDFLHSVRDEESKLMVESLGFATLNTGCPTLWKLTPDFCRLIPRKKADSVVFSLSGFPEQRDAEKDKAFIEILKKNYSNMYFWCQTIQDEKYLDEIASDMDVVRIYSLEHFSKILENGNVDYIGTRLHGGIYALRHAVRTIVISIDHRAEGFHKTNNIVICKRNDIERDLDKLINSEFATEIKIKSDEIWEFKSQFMKEHKDFKPRIHEEMIFIRMICFLKKLVRKVII